MRYTVTTFKVRLEVAESGIRIRNSETAEIFARGIFNRLDADKEHCTSFARGCHNLCAQPSFRGPNAKPGRSGHYATPQRMR